MNSHISEYLIKEKDNIKEFELSILNQVQVFEEKFNKNVVNFTAEEVYSLLFNAKGIGRSTVRNRKSYIRKYLKWQEDVGYITPFEFVSSWWNVDFRNNNGKQFNLGIKSEAYKQAIASKLFMSSDEFVNYIEEIASEMEDTRTFTAIVTYKAILCGVWLGIDPKKIPSVKLTDYNSANRTMCGYKISNPRINNILCLYVEQVRVNKNDFLFQGIKTPLTTSSVLGITQTFTRIRSKLKKDNRFYKCTITQLKIQKSRLYEDIYNRDRDKNWSNKQISNYIMNDCKIKPSSGTVSKYVDEYIIYRQIKGEF